MFQFIAVMAFIIFMLGRGGYFLLSSPNVFRMDKKKNCCTREKKFIWQKEYKIKMLCKLSEIKEATVMKGFFYGCCGLYLKLKSKKIITIFYEYCMLMYSKETIENFDKQANEINLFLKNKREQYIVERPLVVEGVFWTLLGCILLIVVILILYKLV